MFENVRVMVVAQPVRPYGEGDDDSIGLRKAPNRAEPVLRPLPSRDRLDVLIAEEEACYMRITGLTVCPSSDDMTAFSMSSSGK